MIKINKNYNIKKLESMSNNKSMKLARFSSMEGGQWPSSLSFQLVSILNLFTMHHTLKFLGIAHRRGSSVRLNDLMVVYFELVASSRI